MTATQAGGMHSLAFVTSGKGLAMYVPRNDGVCNLM